MTFVMASGVVRIYDGFRVAVTETLGNAAVSRAVGTWASACSAPNTVATVAANEFFMDLGQVADGVPLSSGCKVRLVSLSVSFEQ